MKRSHVRAYSSKPNNEKLSKALVALVFHAVVQTKLWFLTKYRFFSNFYLELRPEENPPNLSLKVVSASRTSELIDFRSFSCSAVFGDPCPLFCELLPDELPPELFPFPPFNLEINVGNCLANSSSESWAACWTSCS